MILTFAQVNRFADAAQKVGGYDVLISLERQRRASQRMARARALLSADMEIEQAKLRAGLDTGCEAGQPLRKQKARCASLCPACPSTPPQPILRSTQIARGEA